MFTSLKRSHVCSANFAHVFFSKAAVKGRFEVHFLVNFLVQTNLSSSITAYDSQESCGSSHFRTGPALMNLIGFSFQFPFWQLTKGWLEISGYLESAMSVKFKFFLLLIIRLLMMY